MLASLGPNATDEQKEQVAKIAEAVRFLPFFPFVKSAVCLHIVYIFQAAQNMTPINNGDMERPPSANGSMISESSTTPPLQVRNKPKEIEPF